ncbi:hypothetical protein [Robiginitalea sp. IMCC43444]
MIRSLSLKAKRNLAPSETYKYNSVGRVQLKGREAPIELVSVSRR